MDLGTIETSDADIEGQQHAPLDDDVSVCDQADSSEEHLDPVNEDDLEIQDEALMAAALACDTTRPDRRPEKAVLVAAFTLAILIHVAGAAICYFLAVVIVAPQLLFTQGSGSSESGLVSERSNQTESQESGVPGPPVALPRTEKTIAAEPRRDNEAQNDPDVSQVRTPTVTALESDLQSLEPVVIGVATDPLGPPPARHHAMPKEAAASAAPAAPPPAPTQVGTNASASSPAGHAIAARHSFVAPRGAGHPGIGAEGSGFDDRGIPVPEYPPESKRRHEEGTVVVEVEVKPDGSVGTARIVKATAYRRLNDCALNSIRSARFIPATVDGRPVTFPVTVPFVFTMN